MYVHTYCRCTVTSTVWKVSRTCHHLALSSFWLFSLPVFNIRAPVMTPSRERNALVSSSLLKSLPQPAIYPPAPHIYRSSRTGHGRWILCLASRGPPQQVSLHAFAQSGLARDEPEQRGFCQLAHNHTQSHTRLRSLWTEIWLSVIHFTLKAPAELLLLIHQ